MEDSTKTVISRIVKIREDKGYSLENMARELGISLSAYNKIEKLQTKLTVERLFKIAAILETDITELLGVETKYQLNQTNKDNATGYLQQIDNFYQENKEMQEKLIQTKDEQIHILNELLSKM